MPSSNSRRIHYIHLRAVIAAPELTFPSSPLCSLSHKCPGKRYELDGNHYEKGDTEFKNVEKINHSILIPKKSCQLTDNKKETMESHDRWPPERTRH